MNFGEKIYELRKKKNISQTSLSQSTGIPQTTISDFERGKYMPNILHLYKIAKALDVPVTDLINNIP